MRSYVVRDLARNPRRTIAAVAGIALAVGLFSGIAFFVDSSAARMTATAVAPVAIDMQAMLSDPLAAPGAAARADLGALERAVRSLPGVRAVHPYAAADLPAGSLRSGAAAVSGPVTVIGIEPAYLQDLPVVGLTGGSFAPGTAFVSGPTADLLRARPGASLALRVPGRPAPLALRLGAVVDLTKAGQLFASRSPDTQGEFAAAPYVVGVDLATFRDVVLPALRADAASAAPVLRAPPVVELHVAVSRGALAADPGTAVVTTTALRRSIERLAPGQLTVIDNLSETLGAAQGDAVTAKVLFLFLGLPGVLLAAYLSQYAGGLLAEAKRRERATLRARGIGPSALIAGLAWESALIALAAAVAGLALGAVALAALFGGAGAIAASPRSYALSAALSLLAAGVTTALALYLPARRALLLEVSEERRQIASATPPAWLRLRLDLAFLVAAALVGGVTYLAGGYTPSAGAESASVSLSFYTLLAPLFLWLGATLLAVRGLLGVFARFAPRGGPGRGRFDAVRSTLAASVLRRPHAVGAGTVALALAVAFGVSVLSFVETYHTEKAADARSLVGADVRVTPSLLAAGNDLSRDLQVPGVWSVTGVYHTSSAVVGTDKRPLVAVDPRAFAVTTPLSDALFRGMTAQAAMSALATDPSAVLISADFSRAFNVQPGDQVRIALPAPRGAPVPVTLRAAGVFVSLPGFPGAADLAMRADTYARVSGAASPDLYLVRTDGTPAGTAAVAAALRSGPGSRQALVVDTTATVLRTDQSSLTALNLDGLGRLEGTYTVLMSALAAGIFVVGLLVRRRGEYVTLRALGMRMADLQTLIVGEAGLVALAGCAIGALVGLAMAEALVQVLRPLFTVPPALVTVPLGAVAGLLAAVIAAALLSALAAGSSLRRARLVELLREE